MIIREATHDDRSQMADILNPIIVAGGTTAYQDPLEPAYFNRFLDDPDPKVFLHVAQTEMGLQGLQWMSPLDPQHPHIGSIATFARPDTVQKGVGTALFAKTRQTSVDVGYTTLYAIIRADNTGGLAYYEKMGFRDHSRELAVPLKDGTPVDRITKRLMLDDTP